MRQSSVTRGRHRNRWILKTLEKETLTQSAMKWGRHRNRRIHKTLEKDTLRQNSVTWGRHRNSCGMQQNIGELDVSRENLDLCQF